MKESDGAAKVWADSKIFDRLLLMGRAGINGNESDFQLVRLDRVVKSADFSKLPEYVRNKLKFKFEVDKIQRENELIDRLSQIR